MCAANSFLTSPLQGDTEFADLSQCDGLDRLFIQDVDDGYAAESDGEPDTVRTPIRRIAKMNGLTREQDDGPPKRSKRRRTGNVAKGTRATSRRTHAHIVISDDEVLPSRYSGYHPWTDGRQLDHQDIVSGNAATPEAHRHEDSVNMLFLRQFSR